MREPKHGVDGAPGADGKDADEEHVISQVLDRIELDTGEDIVEKINNLALFPEYQIDWIHIKNAPEFDKGGRLGSTARNLWQLGDVTLTDLTDNDVLKYNSATGQWVNGVAGSVSPLTTKGDLYTYSTTNDRLPIGTNNQVLIANSSASTGNSWSSTKTLNGESLIGSGNIVVDATVTLADLSANSTTTPTSLYTMTSTIPVEFRSSGGIPILYINETNNSITVTSTGTTGANGGIQVINTTAAQYANIGFNSNTSQIAELGSAFSNGTLVGPAFGHFTNTTNGFVFAAYNAAGYIDFVTGGLATTNRRMRILANGNVGIGTTSPGMLLHLVATASNAGLFRAQNNATNGYAGFELFNSSSVQVGSFGVGNPSASFFANQMYVGTAGAYDLVLMANNAAGITVKNGGNVGVGTTGPDRKLDVLDASAPQLRLTYTDGSVYTDFQTTSAGYLYINPTGGRTLFGDGATAPTLKVHVIGSDFQTSSMGQRRSEATIYGPYQFFEKSRGTVASPAAVAANDLLGGPLFYGYHTSAFNQMGGIQGYMETTTAGGIAFFTTSFATIADAKGVMTSNGRFGWGNLSPSYRLDVAETSTASIQRNANFTLAAGYTGAARTDVIVATNSAAGTGTSLGGPALNAGGSFAAVGSTVGYNVGMRGVAFNGSTNLGFYGDATNTGTYNVGGFGRATAGSTANVGGLFSLSSSDTIPAQISASAGLIADNGSTGSDIFIGQDAGVAVFNIKDGGGMLARYLVEANTAGSGSPNILTAAESRTVLTNEGATALNYNTLPTAVAGLTFTFIVQDADGIRVTANTGDTIRVAGVVSASAGYAESTTIGSALTLVAINATEWVAISSLGTWSLT